MAARMAASPNGGGARGRTPPPPPPPCSLPKRAPVLGWARRRRRRCRGRSRRRRPLLRMRRLGPRTPTACRRHLRLPTRGRSMRAADLGQWEALRRLLGERNAALRRRPASTTGPPCSPTRAPRRTRRWPAWWSPTRVPRRRFGPVPAWRPPDFEEPEDVWVLGTSHHSADSVADVERVLRAVRPDNVVVELCRSRAGIMYVSTDASDEPLLKSNMFSLGGAKFFGAVNRSINLGGQSALALRLLLAVFSSKISSGANRPFGEEFRAARKVSEDIGAQLVLGDRPIEITLERAWKSLSWDEKTNLVISLFRGITSSTDTPDEKSASSPYELYQKLSTSYPSLLQPLIHERDMFLAWSLKRSKAVNKSKTVVGVVGRGHMNGVVYALMSDQGELRFRDLVGRASTDTWVTSLIKGLVRDTIIGLVLWALYEQLKAML